MGSAFLASSAFLVAFSFLLLSHLALYSAQEDSSKCLPFLCGNHNISYPFSNVTYQDCGLSTIQCEYDRPMIKSEGGILYGVKFINQGDNTIVINDLQLYKGLFWGDCNRLYNFQIPSFPTLSFKVKTPNLTLFRCKKNFRPSPKLFPSGIRKFQRCNDSDLFYYSNSEQNLPPVLQPAHQPTPDGCSLIYYPMLLPLDSLPSHFFSSLWEGFSLEWSDPPECRDCGLKCRRDRDGALKECAVTKHGNKMKFGTKLGIGFGAPAGAILLLCMIFIYCRRHRYRRLFGQAKSKIHSPSPTSPSGNTISNPSSKIDLGKGGSTYFGVPIFSYDELVETTNNFDSSKKIGDGGFGTVYHGKLRDGRVVAVKRLYENTFNRVEQFMNEVEILTHLSHQNLVTLYGCTSRHSHDLLLVYEYIPNGTVADHLHGDRANAVSLRWRIRMKIAVETASALSYLHSSDVIHRDVKTKNILLDNDFQVKVADFGLSRLFPLDATHIITAPQGTPGYVDPEYHRCYKLTDKSDVYSFGVVLIELISSMPAVDTNRHPQDVNLSNMAINMIQNGALHELIDPCLGFESDYATRMMITLVAELAFRCLQLDREMRPSMDEVLEVLRGIESEGYKVEKAEAVSIPADDVGLPEPISGA